MTAGSARLPCGAARRSRLSLKIYRIFRDMSSKIGRIFLFPFLMGAGRRGIRRPTSLSLRLLYGEGGRCAARWRRLIRGPQPLGTGLACRDRPLPRYGLSAPEIRAFSRGVSFPLFQWKRPLHGREKAGTLKALCLLSRPDDANPFPEKGDPPSRTGGSPPAMGGTPLEALPFSEDPWYNK